MIFVYTAFSRFYLISLLPRNENTSERTYVTAGFFAFFFIIVSEIKDMQTRIPQVFYFRKSTGLFSSASDQSSRQCLHKTKIDKTLRVPIG